MIATRSIPRNAQKTTPVDSIEKRAEFDFVRYANCWEDADILVEALYRHNQARYLSIVSAGDNTLALLTLDPELVVAVDLSLAQLACLEIRMAGFARLEHAELLAFLGFRDFEGDRLDLYRALRPAMKPASRYYWDDQPEVIRAGIIHAGKFERYLRFFGRRVLPLIHSRKTVEAVRDEKSEAERIAFYEMHWDSCRWRMLFKVFFSRFVLGRSGRDPEFLRYVEGRVADRILERSRFGLTYIPTHDNPYLEYILTGRFERSLPFYAREEHFASIRRNLNCIELVHGTTDDALTAYDAPFDGFNLSDIFEYMDVDLVQRTAGALLKNATGGARLAYWNMLAPRQISRLFPGKMQCLQPLSSDLFRKDRAFFYQAFYVDEVMK